MSYTVRTTLALLVSALALSGLARGMVRAEAYSLADLYSPDHRRWIDSDCPAARSAAEALAKPDAAITPDQAVEFQKAFVACGNMKFKSLAHDMDKVRYLSLAAAGAAFEEAMLTTGPRRDAALARGYTWSDQLSATSNGNTMVVALVHPPDNGGGTLPATGSAGLGGGGDAKANLGGGAPVNGNISGGAAGDANGHDTYQPTRNPFGSNVTWLFGGDAAKLRDQFADLIKTRTLPQQAAPSAPAK